MVTIKLGRAGRFKRALLLRTINYSVRARTEAFQKLFNCLRGIAEQKYKGMIYIRSCFLCIECSRCRARAAEEMERARRTCPRLLVLDLTSYYNDFQYLTELVPNYGEMIDRCSMSSSKFLMSNF